MAEFCVVKVGSVRDNGTLRNFSLIAIGTP
jgi:hypothetical protein